MDWLSQGHRGQGMKTYYLGLARGLPLIYNSEQLIKSQPIVP